MNKSNRATTLREVPALDGTSAVPLYHQLFAEIAQQAKDGVLPAGTRLPSVQEICRSLNLSITTVNRSFQQLKREGYVTAKRGQGTFVVRLAGPTTGVFFPPGYDAGETLDSFFADVVLGMRKETSGGMRRFVVTQFSDEAAHRTLELIGGHGRPQC